MEVSRTLHNMWRVPVKVPPFWLRDGLEWSNDYESYAGYSVATGKVSHARQARGDDPEEKRYPGPPDLVLGFRLTNPHRKNYYCYETQRKPQYRDYFFTTTRLGTLENIMNKKLVDYSYDHRRMKAYLSRPRLLQCWVSDDDDDDDNSAYIKTKVRVKKQKA